MKKLGKKLSYIGLFVGILCGLLLLITQNYVAGQLVLLLEDEVIESCDCKFEVEDISVSFLTLSAKAKNARIIENNKTKLEFEKLKLTFGINDINEKKVYLNRLDLIDGTSYGVGSQSATYKFIDHLTSPSKPTKVKKDKWKVKLLNLRVVNSDIIEDLEETKLILSGINMSVKRTPEDNFTLLPTIKSLKIVSKKNKNRVIPLGKIKGQVDILDDKIEYKNIVDNLEKSIIELSGSSPSGSNDLTGEAKFKLNSEDIQIGSFLKNEIQGSAKLSQKVGAPLVDAIFKTKSPSIIEIDNLKLFTLDEMNGAFKVDFKGDSPSLVLSKLSGDSRDSRVRLKSPISIIDEVLSGSIKYSLDKVKVEGLSLLNSTGILTLSGKIDDPKIEIVGKSKSIDSFGLKLRNTNYDFENYKDIFKLNLTHSSKEYGSMKVDTVLKTRKRAPLLIKKFDFNFKNYAFSPETINYIDNFLISGEGSLSGALKASRLKGKGSLTLASRHFAGESALKGSLKIDRSLLEVSLSNPSKSLNTSFIYNFKEADKSYFQLNLKDFKANEYNPEFDCITTSLDTKYNFNSKKPLLGNGKIHLSKLAIGCAPYTINLKKPNEITINNGTVNIEKIKLAGKNSFASLNGTASAKELNLYSTGNLELQSLAKVIPHIDDLKGSVKADVKVVGKTRDPQLIGTADISNAEFYLESINIGANEFNGKLKLEDRNIKIEKLNGYLNGGYVQILGIVNPINIIRSNIQIGFQDFLYDVSDNLQINSSGILNISQNDSEKLVLAGDIQLNEGSLRKDLGFRSALKTIKNYFSAEKKSQNLNKPINLDLELNISAPRNLFILSNLIETELNSDLKITGSVQNPIITGELKTIYGWFGLKNSRFDLTSGRIFFKPNSTTPYLDILAETNVINHVGESIYIILEAKGQITDPTISLSSDNNLGESQILSLLTTRGLYRAKTRNDTIGVQRDKDLVLIDSDSSLFSKVLSEITSIDSLSIEPAFNNKTGLIEPTLIADKKLTKNLKLSSESFFGGSSPASRFRATYDLANYASLAGVFDSVTTQENTAVGVDLTFTILSKKHEYLNIKINSNEGLDRDKLLQSVMINPDSKIRPTELLSIQDKISKYLVSIGYKDGITKLTCESIDIYCRKLKIDIQNLKLHYLNTINFIKDNLPKTIKVKPIDKGQLASEEFRVKFEKDLIHALRSEGYIKSRLKSRYINDNNTGTSKLDIELFLGQAVSFTFIGNKIFSAEDFLSTINLFSRKQPFGNNTINILLENIERLYRNNGFLYATFRSEVIEDEDQDRINYIINIKEETQIKNTRVSFSGFNNSSTNELKKLVKKENKEFSEQIFNPRFPIAEEIEANIYFIEDIYRDNGYPNVKVLYQLNDIKNENIITIDYLINEGDPIFLDNIEIVNLPEEIDLPTLTERPYSIPKINKNISILLDYLNTKGFRNPSVSTELDFENNILKLIITTIKNTIIGGISCAGNKKVNCATILSNIYFATNSRADQQEINKSKSKLLKLGLFSNINIVSTHRKDNDSIVDIEIQVIEKPLTTLQTGVGINSELGFHVFGEAVDKSFFKDGRTLSLRLDAYYDETQQDISQGVASLRHSNPYFYGTDFKLINDLGYQKFDNPTLEYDLDRIILDNSIHRLWSSGFGFNLGHTILNDDPDNVTPDAILSSLDNQNIILSYMHGSFSYDLRNDPLNPNTGLFLGLDYKISSDTIGSEADFYSAGAKVSWLLPIKNTKFSLANNTKINSAWVFNDTEVLPITQRFYLGGRNSVRGFRENSLGPKGSNGAVLGGDFSASNNFEIRYKTSNNFSLHSFFDIGNTYLRDRDIDLDDLRKSAGVGFRYLSPIGPIGFDFGHPLDEQPGEPSWRVHFNVGSNF